MQLYKRWQNMYRNNPYLQHLTNKQLEDRARDVFVNLMALSHQNKISVLSEKTDLSRWTELWTHVLEEIASRHGPHPAGLKNGFMRSAPVPLPDHAMAAKAAEFVAKVSSPAGNYLVKYGPSKYLRPMYERGACRVCPASDYADTSLNSARRDDELTLELQPPPDVMQELVGLASQLGHPPETPPTELALQSACDFHVYCMSATLQARLFVDFDADSCIVFHDPSGFTETLRHKAAEQLADTHYSEGNVRYVDPVWPGELRPFYHKHFKYWYQQEHRLTWVPVSDHKTLESIDVELGDLGAFGELHLL